MTIRPTMQEAKALCENYSIIPVSAEILSDVTTPIEVMKSIKEISGQCFLLESASAGERWSRYSFLGFDPILTISAKDGVVRENGEIKQGAAPMGEIRNILKQYKSPSFEFLPTFTGGLVGYVAYDSIRYAEPTLRFETDDTAKFDDYSLMLFDKVIAFDDFRKKIVVIVNVKTDDFENHYHKAAAEIEKIISLIRRHTSFQPEKPCIQDFQLCGSREKFIKMVEKAKQYITDGDIFQVVLSQRYKAKMTGDLLNAYRALRTINPSPYMFYMDTGKAQIAGASPETLVRLQGGRLSTFPLAGTRKRGTSEREDRQLAADLLADEKEMAEHNMLVDLGRNDVGRVAKFGSVDVMEYAQVLRFSHVMHIASTVEGELAAGKDAVDALMSLLPAGTLSGAPKIRACQIIDELEEERRGVYGGAVGYIDFSGNMDMCIAIRMAVKQEDALYVQSGAGIVADSVPEKEFEECGNKAMAMLRAIELSGEVEER